LNSRFSDYVGKVGFAASPFEVTYRFRADKGNFNLNRSEIEAAFYTERGGVSLNYLNLRNDPVLGERNEVIGSGSIRLSDYWSWQLGAHHDLERDSLISTSTGLTFQNECLTLLTTAGRNYTSDRDFQESTSFTMRVFLKNLN
jgi:LPS-assembly protein